MRKPGTSLSDANFSRIAATGKKHTTKPQARLVANDVRFGSRFPHSQPKCTSFALRSPKEAFQDPPPPPGSKKKPNDVRFGSLFPHSQPKCTSFALRSPKEAFQDPPPPGSKKTKRREIWLSLSTFAAKMHVVCPAKPHRNLSGPPSPRLKKNQTT